MDSDFELSWKFWNIESVEGPREEVLEDLGTLLSGVCIFALRFRQVSLEFSRLSFLGAF